MASARAVDLLAHGLERATYEELSPLNVKQQQRQPALQPLVTHHKIGKLGTCRHALGFVLDQLGLNQSLLAGKLQFSAEKFATRRNQTNSEMPRSAQSEAGHMLRRLNDVLHLPPGLRMAVFQVRDVTWTEPVDIYGSKAAFLKPDQVCFPHLQMYFLP